MMKTSDPRLIKLHDNVQSEQNKFQRSYLRMKRAFNAMEGSRIRIVRMQKMIRALEDKS